MNVKEQKMLNYMNLMFPEGSTITFQGEQDHKLSLKIASRFRVRSGYLVVELHSKSIVPPSMPGIVQLSMDIENNDL